MKIVLVDDDEVHSDKLTHAFKGVAEVSVVGAYTDPRRALDELEKTKPEVMLTDINMPGLNGIELIKMAKAKMPGMEIIALTVHDDSRTVFDAIKAGADGYLLKNLSGREVLGELLAMGDGGTPLDPKVARLMVREFQEAREEPETALTPKETDVLRKICNGMSYKEIAEKLFVSPHAVHWHVKGIYKKLHAKNRADVLKKARQQGLL